MALLKQGMLKVATTHMNGSSFEHMNFIFSERPLMEMLSRYLD